MRNLNFLCNIFTRVRFFTTSPSKGNYSIKACFLLYMLLFPFANKNVRFTPYTTTQRPAELPSSSGQRWWYGIKSNLHSILKKLKASECSFSCPWENPNYFRQFRAWNQGSKKKKKFPVPPIHTNVSKAVLSWSKPTSVVTFFSLAHILKRNYPLLRISSKTGSHFVSLMSQLLMSVIIKCKS